MNDKKKLQLLNLENIVKMPRHCWVYRPSTDFYYIYAIEKHKDDPQFRVLQRVAYERDANKLTLELNNNISVDTYLEAKQGYKQLMEEKQHETVTNQGKETGSSQLAGKNSKV